jgi:hypothetical protein
MTAAQVIALNPIAFEETLERRVAELWDLLHTATMELTILRSELRLLRAGHKSSLEVKAALVMREMSVCCTGASLPTTEAPS